MTKALCFDQSSTNTGWAAGSEGTKADFGLIKIPKRDFVGERLHLLRQGVLQLADKYEPDIMAIETPFFPVDMAGGASWARGKRGVAPAAGFLAAEIQDTGAEADRAAFSPETIKILQKVAGTIETIAAELGVPLESYAPASWRKTVLGYGRKPKGEAADFMKRETVKRLRAMGYDLTSADEAEALGILHHCLHGPEAAKRRQGSLLDLVAGRL